MRRGLAAACRSRGTGWAGGRRGAAHGDSFVWVRARNSWRVLGSSRTRPCSADVIVVAPAFWTPRSDMHRCSASSTTPTPDGRELALQPVGDLRRQPLLDLDRPGEVLDDPRELGQADDPLAREVGDVRDADEREQVVLTQRVERDVARDDELVVAAVVGEARRREGARGQQFGVHARDARGRVREALVGEVGAERDEEVARGALGRMQVDAPALLLGEQVQRADCEIGSGGHASVRAAARRFLTAGKRRGARGANEDVGHQTRDPRHRYVDWRTQRLLDAGFGEADASRVGHDPGYDLHALLELIDRGCPPALAMRILAPWTAAP